MPLSHTTAGRDSTRLMASSAPNASGGFNSYLLSSPQLVTHSPVPPPTSSPRGLRQHWHSSTRRRREPPSGRTRARRDTCSWRGWQARDCARQSRAAIRETRASFACSHAERNMSGRARGPVACATSRESRRCAGTLQYARLRESRCQVSSLQVCKRNVSLFQESRSSGRSHQSLSSLTQLTAAQMPQMYRCVSSAICKWSAFPRWWAVCAVTSPFRYPISHGTWHALVYWCSASWLGSPSPQSAGDHNSSSLVRQLPSRRLCHYPFH